MAALRGGEGVHAPAQRTAGPARHQRELGRRPARYAAWLSGATGRPYRLLTEAEWEYAARGGTDTRYSWGDAMLPGRASCKDCGEPVNPQDPPQVEAHPPNPFGLHGMGGGVAEWVADCWHHGYQGAPRDGAVAWDAPDCRKRTLRGGSWMDEAANLRVSSREYYDAPVRYPTHGFRVARPARRPVLERGAMPPGRRKTLPRTAARAGAAWASCARATRSHNSACPHVVKQAAAPSPGEAACGELKTSALKASLMGSILAPAFRPGLSGVASATFAAGVSMRPKTKKGTSPRGLGWVGGAAVVRLRGGGRSVPCA